MTINEASEQYNIPISVLREYESWGLCDTVKTVMGVWQYDEEDIERLSMIMTLHDIGFEHDEIANYMRLLLQGDSTQQLYAGMDPAAVFCREQAFQIEERAGTRVLTVWLPYAREEELRVEKDGGDLLLKIQNQVRRFHLPELLGRRNLSGWAFEQGELSIRLDY